jgi:uncharacterized protein YndB with AHSA1/START domain
MTHGTYETVDGRPALRFERRLAHPVERVWRAVTEPGELAHWFPAEVALAEPREGATMTFTFSDGIMPPSDGTITVYDPPRRFAFVWGEDELRFELEPLEGGAGCLLRFTHLLDGRDRAARDAAGWHVCLDTLEQHLAGEPAQAPTGEQTDEHRALYDDYVGRGMPHGAPIPG